jgi:hypothetical protein
MSTPATPKRRTPRFTLFAAILAGLLLAYHEWRERRLGPDAAPQAAETVEAAGATAVREAFRAKRSGVAVRVVGRVDRVLPDDDDGSRHQRFIVRLADGHTVLVAHNIDLAPRVPLAVGDEVELGGDFEWSEQGGVIHWTHRDPAGRHADGFVRHRGKTYR